MMLRLRTRRQMRRLEPYRVTRLCGACDSITVHLEPEAEFCGTTVDLAAEWDRLVREHIEAGCERVKA